MSKVPMHQGSSVGRRTWTWSRGGVKETSPLLSLWSNLSLRRIVIITDEGRAVTLSLSKNVEQNK